MMTVFWFLGIEKCEQEPLRPSSPWMPFPTLISVLSKFLAPCDIAMISKFYKEKKVSVYGEIGAYTCVACCCEM